MANRVSTQTIKFTGQFDTSQITKGLQDIKKQVSGANIGDELKKQFEDAFKKLEVNIPALEKLTSKEDFNLKDIQALQKLLKEVTKDWENLNKVTNQIDLSKTFSAKDLEKINNLDKQIKQTQDNIQKARKELVDAFTKNNEITVSNKNVSDALTELFTVNPTEIDSKFKEIQDQFSEGVQQTQIELENKLKDANIQKTGKSLIDYFFGENSGVDFADKVGPVKEQINGIIRAYRDAQQKGDIAGVAEQVQKLNEVLTNTANFKFPEGYQLFGLPTQEDLNTLNLIGSALDKLKEVAKGKEVFFTEEEARLVELVKQKIEAEAEAARNSNNDHQQFTNTLQQTGNAFEDAGKKVDKLNDQYNKIDTQSKALSATFGSLANRITNSISALTIFNKSIQIIHKAINSVQELDAAFTQIAIVSEQSNESAWKMFDSFNKLAKQYSITTKDLTEGAKLFYQQGLNAADTMKMVEASTVSAALGEVTMTEAANTLTAAIQGYNESAAVAMDYTDKIAMVGAVSAADFNELSTAMEKTASSAYTAGIDFDHLLGYLGKMIEVTREAPANLGTAMKTIIARFEDMKKDPMAVLEDGVSANKVEAALATIGIALRDSEGEFRALQDVMDELGGKWSSLTRNQQAYIATVAAGSRQQSRFLALMNNYDRTLELVAESQNSAGAAVEQYAVYQDSAAAATARLTAAWEEFYTKIVNSEQIIWVIDRLKDLVEVMTEVGPVISAIGASVGALGLQTIIKGVIPKLTSGIAEAAVVGNTASISIGNLLKTSGALVLSFGKVIIVTAAVAAAITAIVWVAKRLDKAFNKNRETINNLTKDIQTSNKKIEEYSKNTSSLEKLMDRYDELANKVYHSKEEQEELNDIINQINENSERAIVSIKANGDAHLDNAKSVREEIEAKKDLVKFEANQKYNKQQEIFKLQKEGKTITAKQAQEAGLSDLAEYLELQEDENVKQYKQIKEDLKSFDDLNVSEDFYKLSERILTKQEQERVNAIGQKYGIEGENTSWGNIKDSILDQEKIQKRAEEISKETGMIYATAEYKATEEARGKVLEAAQDFIDAVYNEDVEFLEKYTNDEYVQQEFINAENQSLRQKYTSKASVDNRYNILLDLFEKTGMSAEEFQHEIEDEEQFFKDYSNALDEYNESEKTPEDVQKLIDAITKGKEKIANALSQYVDDIIKQSFASQSELQQFTEDNYNLFSSSDKGQITRSKVKSGSITNDELSKMKELAKTTEFEDNDKFSLFNLFAEDDTELNDLLNKYLKKVSEGLYQDADIVKQAIIDLLANKDITGPAAEKLADFFVPDYQTAIEKRLGAATENYKTAQSIYNKDPQEGLDDKEYDFLKQQDKNIDRYIAINKEGEKYLTILGKIAILENSRNEYVNSLNLKIQDNNNSLEIERKNLEEAIQKVKDQEEGAENLVELTKQRINELEQENNLLQQQSNTTDDIVNKTMSISLKENLSQAEQFYDNINKIGKALGEAQQNAGQLSFATAQSLLAMDDAYYQYINIVDGMVKIDTEGANKMMENEKAKYDTWLDSERKRLNEQISIYEAENKLIEEYFVNSVGKTEEEKRIYLEALQTELTKKEEQLNNLNKGENDANKQSLVQTANYLSELELEYKQFYETIVNADRKAKEGMASEKGISEAEISSLFRKIQDRSGKINASVDIKVDQIDWNEEDVSKIEQQLRDKFNSNLKRIEILQGVRDNLEDLSPAFQEAFNKGISEAVKGGEKAVKDFTKTIEDLMDALEDLDKLLKDIQRDLRDITVDYNPFTDLFEAWEHEWDYYYNIKRLIAQIGTQGEYIDNIISADYTSADQKIEGQKAKIGNLVAKMAANDTYITALRAGMSQTGVELMREFGQYYKVNAETGQIYQTDANLSEINTLINQRKQEIFDMQKLQNEKENDLALENAKLDALEQEKSAYESTLSIIESQLDSLKDNEEIIANISQLENEKASINTRINITDTTIDEAKQTIRSIEDEIEEIEIDITLKGQDVNELEKYVDRMEDKVSEYEEYWENLNSTISEQQQILQELADIRGDYIDTSISTEKQLYNAIIENYQDEINKKKNQYNYLKQLDQDYLRSIKDNINTERQAREDANKQRSYIQNQQRAQLLKMDTSGAFRSELAQLNKEIESQRQDLYDDLVDKQVEALEKEIEKRHELYDKEVTALEERLAYMQENAILLWESVNSIVAEGADAMMAVLENTTEYMNANELERIQLRNEWELNVKKTFEGTEQGLIDTLNGLVEAGNEFIIDKYPEVGEAIDNYTLVFENAKGAIEDYNFSIKNGTEVMMEIFNAFMSDWNSATNNFTGYAEDWSSIIDDLIAQTDQHKRELRDFYDEEGIALQDMIGSIYDFNNQLLDTSQEIYDDFILERQRYRDELDGLIKHIQSEISDAIGNAGNGIQNAANSISFSSPQSGGSGGGNPSTVQPTEPIGPTGPTEPEKETRYKATITEFDSYKDYVNERNGRLISTYQGYYTPEAARAAAAEALQRLKKNKNTSGKYYIVSQGIPYAFLHGGLANFTGPAWLDGTKSNPEAVLNAKQTRLFTSMVSSLERAAANNSNINSALGSSYNIGDINTNINVEKLDNETDIDRVARQVENRIMKSVRNRVSLAIA